MRLLADCVLSIDGTSVPLSLPAPAAGVARARRTFVLGVPHLEVERLSRMVGRVGVVHSRSGVVLMRVELTAVMPDLSLIEVAPAGRELPDPMSS